MAESGRRLRMATLAGLCLLLSLPVAAGPDPWQGAARRALLMQAYLDELAGPPCGLNTGPSLTLDELPGVGLDGRRTALHEHLQSAKMRDRLARIPREIDALLKSGESSGIAYGDTCRGLAAQFRGSRRRALDALAAP